MHLLWAAQRSGVTLLSGVNKSGSALVAKINRISVVSQQIERREDNRERYQRGGSIEKHQRKSSNDGQRWT